jgi:hypothetical protein
MPRPPRLDHAAAVAHTLKHWRDEYGRPLETLRAECNASAWLYWLHHERLGPGHVREKKRRPRPTPDRLDRWTRLETDWTRYDPNARPIRLTRPGA